jgi:hypothetical protein
MFQLPRQLALYLSVGQPLYSLYDTAEALESITCEESVLRDRFLHGLLVLRDRFRLERKYRVRFAADQQREASALLAGEGRAVGNSYSANYPGRNGLPYPWTDGDIPTATTD